VRSSILSDDLIILNGRSVGIISPINESSIGSVSILSNISGRDVVTDSQNAIAVILSNAALVRLLGESNVDGVEETIGSRTQVVVSGEGDLNAKRSGDSPGLGLHPGSTLSSTFNGVVLLGVDLLFGHLAVTLGLDVLGLLLVEFAVGFVVSKNGNISPGRRMPVGIVVTFLSTLIAVTVAVVVLTGEDSRSTSSVQVALLFSVRDPQSHVSLSSGAVLIVSIVLVHSIEQVSITIYSHCSIFVIGNSIGGGSISNEDGRIGIGVGAHVLDNHVAIELGIHSATVLYSPFNGQLRSLIIGHGRSHTVSSLSIVLGVKQSISIVSVGIGLV